MFSVPERYRVTSGDFGSDRSYGNNGAFLIPPNAIAKHGFLIIASDGMDWEHVSVSVSNGKTPSELPTHNDMEALKTLFWGDDCWVMELHPPASEYVNNAPALHLWRPVKQEIPTPFSIMVGV
ncbi:MAG: DUF7694 domain-containing protein [Shewanella sp.]|uniref:DUF7694 domain-containing protein n=1 Tax=Shewanella sp. TaxID=50422 RepID=UPI003F39B33B